MKKLFNGKFLIILASSLIVLILLVVGAFYLFDDKDDVFVKSGYVLNPLSSTSEKYYFNENVGYKENLSSMIEFVDVDEKTVSILKDSFVHYMDESISLLKNGAILDLDSVDGKKAVSFYNITNESIIENKGNGYVIESSNGKINLNNFIARISDNKYIVVGDLSLKMVGNDTGIKGDYFEIVYVEEGIVNIENKDVKYQVAAEDTFINVGSDKVIDLGKKSIVVNGIDIMSITSITIDGDENIEIIPKGNEDEEDEPSDGDNNDDQQDDNDLNDDGSNGASGDDGQSGGEGNDDNITDEPGEGGTENDNTENENTEEIEVSVKNIKIGSTNINVTYEIKNATEKDKFLLKVVNLSSGRTFYMDPILSEVNEEINLMTPNTKYLFMVIDEKNNKYYQSIEETSGFGIKMEKSYVTDSSLAYTIVVDEDFDIYSANLSLYKFNEKDDVMANEIVSVDEYEFSCSGDCEVSNVMNEKGEMIKKIKFLSPGEYKILYEDIPPMNESEEELGIVSNSIYTVVLDEFSLASTNFKDIYNITLTNMTLKKIPGFDNMSVTKDVNKSSFNLSLDGIDDPDYAIVKYTYEIYEKNVLQEDGTKKDVLAITPIVNKSSSPINVRVGDGEEQLKGDTLYDYRVIIEYFDNEKYIEYVTGNSIDFLMGSDPMVTIVPKQEDISYDSIGATIYLSDNSCLISIPGREKCSGPSTTVVQVSRVSSVNNNLILVKEKEFDFEITDDGVIKYDFFMDGLQAGTTYNIEVKAKYNNEEIENERDSQELIQSDESKRRISTHSLSSFNVEWSDMGSSENHVVNTKAKFLPINGTGSMTPEESAAELKQVVISLYEGDDKVDLDRRVPMAKKYFENSDEFNIKEQFYDRGFVISSTDTFGFSMQSLKDKSSKGELSEYYTISIEAYYDTDGTNKAKLYKEVFPYKISPVLLMEDVETVLEIKSIDNATSGNLFGNLINGGTKVGYKLIASFSVAELSSRNLFAKKINFYVYDLTTKNKLNFYYKSEKDGRLVIGNKFTLDVDESGYFETEIFMDYGLDYGASDIMMRRGNKFYLGYEITGVDDENQAWTYPMASNPDDPSDFGVWKKMDDATKEIPSVKMYISKATKDSITYNYTIKDPDNSIYKEDGSDSYKFYYNINSGDENSIDMLEIEGADYKQFEGRLTIDGLTNNDKYSLYYKKSSFNNGDISNYINGSSPVRTFDGFYDFGNNVDVFNFRYKIINDATKDNRVIIKILSSDTVVERILSYRINFKDSKGNELNKELWKLTTCSDGTNRCLSIDYMELKNAGMQSINDEINQIKVTVTALYDNGLMGYDYKVGSSAADDYLYCIMQGNSSENGMGSYIVFNGSGLEFTVWNESLDIPKGYFTYSYKHGDTLLSYKSELRGIAANISVNLSSVGYSSKNGVLNPKMVSVDNMECESSNGGSCNTFYFSSINPKVTYKEKGKLINGSVVNLTLSGIDLNDIKNEGSKASPEYYLYIETWDNKADAENDLFSKTARPVVKARINNDSPTTTISATIDGLKEYNLKQNTGVYYFNVYAYRYVEGQFRKLQLFDGSVSTENVEKTYSFESAKAGDLFRTFSVGIISSNEVYGDRTLNSKISLNPYKGGLGYNFDVIYVLCDVEDAATCGPNEGDSKIFTKTILEGDFSTTINDTINISEFDLEFNKNYYLMVYVSSNHYTYDEQNSKWNVSRRPVLINVYDKDVKLPKLSEPSFVVTRNAMLENGDYLIDFDIVVNDVDRTLVDGKYFIKLIDNDGNIVGNMQLLDEDGSYYDVPNYQEYAFDAFTPKKKVRIKGLKSNTKYTFEVYNDAYLNNFDDGVTQPGRENRTKEISKSYTVYSTNDYGVAFGTATYGVTASSVVVTFLGGSNFNNVVEVNYTVGNWDDAQSSDTLGGTFAVGNYLDPDVEYDAVEKKFEIFSNSEDWRFVLDPKGMRNVLGKTYQVIISFKVKVPGTEDQYVVLTHDDVESFKGTVTYYEDEKKK